MKLEEKQIIIALGEGATTKFVLPELNVDESYRIERVDEMIQRKITKMEELKWH